jgi:hypothetical protein
MRLVGKSISLITLSFCLAACDGGMHLSAHIVDSEGVPVDGALATASRDQKEPEFTGTTNKQGCVSLGGLTAPGNYDFQVTISAPDYKTFHVAIPTIERNALRIVLAKKSQAFTGQALSITPTDENDSCGAI